MNVFGSHCDRPTRRPHLPIRLVLELVGLWRYRDRSIAMLISSHQLNELQELCGRFLFIKDGRLADEFAGEQKGSRLSSLAGRSVSRNVRRSRLWIRPPSFILILPAVNLFNSDFMKVSGKTGSVSVLDFLAGEFVVQNMLMLPPGSRPAVRERGPHRAPRCEGRRGHGVT